MRRALSGQGGRLKKDGRALTAKGPGAGRGWLWRVPGGAVVPHVAGGEARFLRPSRPRWMSAWPGVAGSGRARSAGRVATVRQTSGTGSPEGLEKSGLATGRTPCGFNDSFALALHRPWQKPP